ncbi:unnamed protein product, partial [Prorocentrum cordatum]
AYEGMRTADIYKSIDVLFAAASEKIHATTITVDHTQRTSVRLGGSISPPHRDRTVFRLHSLQRCLECFMGMRMFRLGDLFVVQENGAPIGGPLSGCILDLVLSLRECVMDKTWGLNWSNRRQEIAAARYVDDLLLMS